MTLQAGPALAVFAHTVPPEARHRHDSACYWDVESCRWQCATYPVSPPRSSAAPRSRDPSADNRPEARP